MCSDCWREYGSPAIFNEKTLEGARLVVALYEVAPAGGDAHVVTDDWNIDDECIDACIEGIGRYYDDKETNDRSRAVLEAFKSMTEDERVSALAIEAGFISPPSQGGEKD